MASQNSPETIAKCTRLPIWINTNLKRFFVSLLIAHRTSSFLQHSNSSLYAAKSRHCSTDDFLLVSRVHCEHRTPSILEEKDRSSFVSFAAKSFSFQLFFCITFQNILLTWSSNLQDLCYFLVLFGSRQSLA